MYYGLMIFTNDAVPLASHTHGRLGATKLFGKFFVGYKRVLICVLLQQHRIYLVPLVFSFNSIMLDSS